MVVGEKPFLDLLSKVDSKRKKHIDEFVAANQAMAPAVEAPTPAAPTPAAAPVEDVIGGNSTQSEAMSFDMGGEPAPPKKKRSPAKPEAMAFDMGGDEGAAAPPKRPPPARLASKTASKPAAKSVARAPVEEVEEGPPMSEAEVDAMLEEAIQAEVRAKLASKAWKERLEGVNEILESVNTDQIQNVTQCGEALIAMLGTTPGWKESNFQVRQGSRGGAP